MEQKFSDIVSDVISRYGMEILLNGNRFCAIMADFASKKDKEMRVLRRVRQENLLNEIYSVLMSHENNRGKKLDAKLIEAGFSEEWRDIVLNTFGLVRQPVQDGTPVQEKQPGASIKSEQRYFGQKKAKEIWDKHCSGCELQIPDGYTVICANAFEFVWKPGNKVSRLILPDTLYEIREGAFSSLYITDYIEIPESVQVIGDILDIWSEERQDIPFKLGVGACVKCSEKSYAYRYCKEHGIETLSDRNLREAAALAATLTREGGAITEVNNRDCSGRILYISNVDSVGKRAFLGIDDFDILVIGSGVKYIKREAFESCSNLKYVYISDTICSIASNAFVNCHNLQYVKYDILNLEKSYQGNNERTFFIADNAFDGCDSLKIIVSNGYQFEAFCQHNNLMHLYVSNSIYDKEGNLQDTDYVSKKVKSILDDACEASLKKLHESWSDMIEAFGDEGPELLEEIKELIKETQEKKYEFLNMTYYIQHNYI